MIGILFVLGAGFVAGRYERAMTRTIEASRRRDAYRKGHDDGWHEGFKAADEVHWRHDQMDGDEHEELLN
jgi:hypothetical protein